MSFENTGRLWEC